MNKKFLNEIREELLTSDLVNAKGKRNRSYRMAISELREEGVIFVPIGKYMYQRIEKCNKEQIDKYINITISSWKTQYFKTILPIKEYMDEEQLKELHNGGLIKEGEE